jgi:Lon protease-like protein
MPITSQIPLFPLPLLPIPGELVPLHIFEPRFKQLLEDAETRDISFGVYCNHQLNEAKIGSLMKLESVIKRHPTGEADIVVRCSDLFSLQRMNRNFKMKMYPGGDVEIWQVDINEMADARLYEIFLEYQTKRSISNHMTVFNLYQMASELNLDLYDRYKFLRSSYERKISFLSAQLKFQIHIVKQEEKSKDVYHLN